MNGLFKVRESTRRFDQTEECGAKPCIVASASPYSLSQRLPYIKADRCKAIFCTSYFMRRSKGRPVDIRAA